MRVRFHGAAGEVTGSCHEVEAGGYRFLFDCGMIQGSHEDERRNRDPFAFDVESIDAVVLSHAHIDHCGRLPLLVSRGFKGPIWTQAASADLLRIMLEDAASLAEADAERARRHRGQHGKNSHNGNGDDEEPLFTRSDVAQVLRQVRPIGYEKPTQIADGVTITLHDAGHILGSAIVSLQAEGKTLVFSGDLGPKGTPILRDAKTIDHADLLLMESTYGDRNHRDRQATVAEIGEIFDHAWREGGNVLIPAFAVGRSQELLYWFAKHWDDWGLARWKIFLDSPMAIKVLEVYDRHESLFDADAQKVWNGRPHPFRMPNLRLSTSVDESRGINAHDGGSIIIAGSGMCNGGRIRHHLRHNLGKKHTHVIFAGYQANGTLGRRLVDRAPRVRIFGEEINVNAQIHTIGGLSAHIDQNGLLQWYSHFANRPKVVLVHGEDKARLALADKLDEQFSADVSIAKPLMELSVGN